MIIALVILSVGIKSCKIDCTVIKILYFVLKGKKQHMGKLIILRGNSGSGKTTVSRLAARFWDINKGTITVGGMDISKIDPETLLSLYSIVFQDVTLFNNTIMEHPNRKKRCNRRRSYGSSKISKL